LKVNLAAELHNRMAKRYFLLCNVSIFARVITKNSFMKQAIIFLLIIWVTMLSCKKINSISSSPLSLEGKWRMIVVKDNASGVIITKPSSIQGNVDITFSSQSATDGFFYGNTPSNEIGQNAYSIGFNHLITIPVLSMTKVMETSWGDQFVNNIRGSHDYNFEIGGDLNIKTSGKTLTFRKL
jgi:hypothetical protein